MKFGIVAGLALTTSLLTVEKAPARCLAESAALISALMATPDKGIPRDPLDKAHCVVIVPELKTAAFMIMLVMSERGADKLLSSKFTLGAEGSVAAGPVGRTATAQTDAQMHGEILSWTRSQGLFDGLALEGGTLRRDLDDNATLYGQKLENREIVTGGRRPPKSAAALLALLNKQSLNESAERPGTEQ